MIKKYKHKPTGIIVEHGIEFNKKKMYCDRKENICYPPEIIESGSDWEEIKEPVIPPGILVMHNDHLQSAFKSIIKHTYEEWYESFNAMGFKPYTISVHDVEWSVGDWYHNSKNTNYQIKSFKWGPVAGQWCMNNEDQSYCYFGEEVRVFKGKYREPICQLPDENGKMVDMTNGDKYVYVDGFWNMHDVLVGNDCGGCNPLIIFTQDCFATKAAAEKYVRDNKPVYPAGLVEPLFDLTLTYGGIQKYSYRIGLLKLFKKNKLDKK